MYDLSSCYDNTLDVMYYTVTAMRETGFTQSEIEDYVDEATKSHNSNLIDVSIEYVNKCNEKSKAYYESYESFDDEDLSYNCNDYNDYSYSKYWGRDFDEDYDEIESYEGFTGHGQSYQFSWNQDFGF